jgi:hypothetical protein
VAYTSSGAWVVPGWSVSPPPFSASYYDSNGALVGFTSSNDGCEAYDDAFRWPTCSPTPFDAHCGAGKGGDAATDASDGSAAPSDASSLD